MSTVQVICTRCGSTKLRHARSRNALHRLVRELSDWDRYACVGCGYRGWRHGKLPYAPQGHRPPPSPQGRPLERRDVRYRRRRDLGLNATVVLGLVLGAMVANIVIRLASSTPRLPGE